MYNVYDLTQDIIFINCQMLQSLLDIKSILRLLLSRVGQCCAIFLLKLKIIKYYDFSVASDLIILEINLKKKRCPSLKFSGSFQKILLEILFYSG